MTWQRIPLKERIERNCVLDSRSGCWLWTSCLDSDGYGYLHNRTMGGAKNMKAHRIAFQEFVGPIPDGKYVCHTCDVPSCVNPAHLWIGNHQENTKDRVRKGRSCKGMDRPNAKLTEESVIAIRAASGTMKAIGLQFGVCPQHIHAIRLRKIWKHV